LLILEGKGRQIQERANRRKIDLWFLGSGKRRKSFTARNARRKGILSGKLPQ